MCASLSVEEFRSGVLEDVALRCHAFYHRGDAHPPVFGFQGVRISGSLVAVGEASLEALCDHPPVSARVLEWSRAEIEGTRDVERGINASIYLAHAISAWVYFRDQLLYEAGRVAEPPQDAVIQSVFGLKTDFPISDESEWELMGKAASGFRAELESESTDFGRLQPLGPSAGLLASYPPTGPDVDPMGGAVGVSSSEASFIVTAVRHTLKIAMGSSFERSPVDRDSARVLQAGQDGEVFRGLRQVWLELETRFHKCLAQLEEDRAQFLRAVKDGSIGGGPARPNLLSGEFQDTSADADSD